jgi:hypothetical protein
MLGTHDNLVAVNPKFESAFKNVSDLFVYVAVHWHVASLLQQHAR